MRQVNRTPFVVAPIPSSVSPPAKSLTIVVKGTFDLIPGSACTASATQYPLSADKPYLDEIGRSLAWASDLAPFKPHTDFFIIGSFHQPRGIAAAEGRAWFRLGPLYKELAFFGPRYAIQAPDKTWVVTPPQPIDRVPLRWEYSFGGLSDRRNPMGMGIETQELADGSVVLPLPLIEDPAALITTLKDRPVPANFAPVPQGFLSRRRKLGTRDRRWSVFRAPLPPKDFDPSYHNAAPDDQQAGNYPLGDEVLTLHNLHPTLPDLSTKLPSLRVRMVVLRRKGTAIIAEEVTMNLDTIVALPDDDQIVLTWRGTTAVTMDFVPDEFVLFHYEAEALNEPSPVRNLADKVLAEYQDAVDADAAKDAEYDAAAWDEMRKLLPKANLPPDVLKIMETETDPVVLDKVIKSHIDKVLSELEAKYMGIGGGTSG